MRRNRVEGLEHRFRRWPPTEISGSVADRAGGQVEIHPLIIVDEPAQPWPVAPKDQDRLSPLRDDDVGPQRRTWREQLVGLCTRRGYVAVADRERHYGAGTGPVAVREKLASLIRRKGPKTSGDVRPPRPFPIFKHVIDRSCQAVHGHLPIRLLKRYQSQVSLRAPLKLRTLWSESE